MYAAYIALFEPLLGASAPARPLQVENAVKVSGSWCMVLIDWCGAVAWAGCRQSRLGRCCLWHKGSLSCSALPLVCPSADPFSVRAHLFLPRLQVGQKRGRSQLEELNAEVLDGTKRKKIRLVSVFE